MSSRGLIRSLVVVLLNCCLVTATTTCGEEFKTELGSFQWKGSPTGQRSCDWRIHSPFQKPILLRINTMKITSEDNACGTNYVSVNDLNGDSQTNLGIWCGTEPEDVWILSTGPSLLIQLRTEGSNADDHLDATFISPKYQYDYDQTRTYIKSPPDDVWWNYPLRCLWRIRVPDNYQLRLQFQRFFVMGRGSDCYNDGLGIFEGTAGALTHVDQFCGNENPPPIESYDKQLTLFLNTSIKSLARSFLVYCASDQNILRERSAKSFKHIISQISGELDLRGTVVNSAEDAQWILKPVDGKKIILTVESFSIGNSQTDCERNYVKVYDGETADANILGTYCGTVTIVPIVSSGPRLFIHLHRPDAISADQFKARYVSSSCSEAIKTPSGLIKWSKQGTPEFDCIWKLDMRNSAPIDLRFQHMMVKSQEAGCLDSFLEVYDGTSGTARMLRKTCGPIILPSVRSTGPHMTIYVHVNQVYAYHDFEATYESMEDCHRYRAPSGLIEWRASPDSSKDCVWVIQPRNKKRIFLQFSRFNLGGQGTPCTNNTLKVFNGYRKTCCLVGDYCGHHNELVFLSSRPRMDLHLISAEFRSGDNFKATYEAPECQFTLNNRSGTFTAPPEGFHFRAYLNCLWNIQKKQNQRIDLNFIRIDLDCNEGSVVVYSGTVGQLTQLASYCGRLQNKRIISWKTDLVVYIRATGLTPLVIFAADYTIEDVLQPEPDVADGEEPE
ncbi:hypothetical protein CRM22_005736 [Opisthorchis felineus]|uniref:CUB domain-containing protein n=1 Tax=Opisthorchis felineus TaxID=147828 RepID=A0A4V6RGZ6_OPIFE|nr:hypothetical protein CRM22_005736 [Opisthorchis felineus]